MLAMLLLLGAVASPPLAATTTQSATASFLYEVAREYRRAGHLQEAIYHLHKVLLMDPSHQAAARELVEIQSLMRSQRDEVIDRVIAERQRELSRMAMDMEGKIDGAVADYQKERLSHLASERAAPSSIMDRPRSAAEPSRRWWPWRGRTRTSDSVRVPDPRVNGVKWFYVFGPDGSPDYGALKEPQHLFVEVPRASSGPVSIRVLDADTKGRRDEMAGGWNTATAFRVFGGATLLDSCVIGPDHPDGTTRAFGPYSLEQGARHGESSVFRVEAEGLEGNDNNLFAFEISPSSAQCFSYSPAVRLPNEPGAQAQFFPAVPEGTVLLNESNYDLDADGGRIALISYRRDGRVAGAASIAASNSEAWATTQVGVPPRADGARWTYRVTTGTQHNANMAFRVADQSGRPLPTYLTPGAALGMALPAAAPPAVASTSCNTFTFDASSSYDPDKDLLTCQWNFGDGTSADGVRVTHTYDTPGDYQVTLKVTDTSGRVCGTSQAEQVVHVNLPPKAVLDAPAGTMCAGAVASFSAAKSSGNPLSGRPMVYRWDFGDGTTGEGLGATHAYAKGGSYMVQLVVDDGRGTACSTDRAGALVRVNTPPVARANDAITMCAPAAAPLAVSLNAIESNDPDRDALTYRWDFGDGSTGEGLRAPHVYQRGGRYTATLTVDDGTGSTCSTAATTVPIHLNRGPQAVIGPAAGGCVGETMTLDAGRSSDPDGDALAYQWQLGEGKTAQGATAQFSPSTHGKFPVKLTVDDGSGMACAAASAETVVNVNAPPVARMEVFGDGLAAPPSSH